MAKLTLNADCGNSPKLTFIKEFNIAFGEGDDEFLVDCVTDDIIWEIVGEKTIEGKEKYKKEILKMKEYKVSEMVVDKVLSHGKTGAANGVLSMSDGKRYAFADFYEFKSHTSTQLKSITSYSMEVE
ncbi:nuclear transport factor 2 family protein [Portibacter marinus]|uniref:nuclear transport factor 2 family protein n=1 Tax=Portibacter marinus TaxID=2898660 RepID=UPI001F268C26|nr:nuclear transport factor 2 family protein [Portibacter marinus]